MSRTFATEFPDFPAATMPPIPDGWEDQSWHNDVCPSFWSNGFQVYIDYDDASLREFPDVPTRFSVLSEGDVTTVSLLETNDWQAVLDLVASAG